MNKVLMYFLAFLGVGLIFLGILFLIGAGGQMDNYAIAAVMLIAAVAIFVFIYRAEMSRPVTVQQTFNVQLGGSGKLVEKQLKCKSCGAPLEDGALAVISGGLMVKCPYCRSAYALEEAPKW